MNGVNFHQVTPAHDPNDYLCGKRNGLDFIIVLTGDGKIAANGGKFAGIGLAQTRKMRSMCVCVCLSVLLNVTTRLRAKAPWCTHLFFPRLNLKAPCAMTQELRWRKN